MHKAGLTSPNIWYWQLPITEWQLAIYAACKATVKVGDGKEITFTKRQIILLKKLLPLLFLPVKRSLFRSIFVFLHGQGAEVRVNGKKVSVTPVAGKYLCINREWANGDRVELTLPMSLSMRTWQVNKNSVSVDYGPLTLSLKIAEKICRERQSGNSYR